MAEAVTTQLALALEVDPERALPDRLFQLGLAPGTLVTLTQNRTVLVSHHPRFGLRLHAGYAWAPDDVLSAILCFVRPRVARSERLRARQRFLAFPVHRHAPSRVMPHHGPRPVAPEHEVIIGRLTRLHEILNVRHFQGTLGGIPIRLSERMSTRLGEFRADHDHRPVEITLSRRHVRRDGWAPAAETLLHEMVHQWQCEQGMPLDHGLAFRQKAREVGIRPNAIVPVGHPAPMDLDGTIA